MMQRNLSRREWIAALGVSAAAPAFAQTPAHMRHHGVIVRLGDLDRALGFFGDGLGFPVGDLRPQAGFARLAANVPIYLEVAQSGRLPAEDAAHVEITFRSNDLALTQQTLRAAGARILTAEPYEVAVGRSIRFADTFGIVHHMLQANRPGPMFAEPRVYNSGFVTPHAAIAPTRGLLEGALGFRAMTEQYYPPSIPYFEADGGFAFMLHENQPFERDWRERSDPRADDWGPCEIFTTHDLRAARAAAVAGGATALDRRPRRFAYGERLAFATPGGAPFEMWRWA